MGNEHSLVGAGHGGHIVDEQGAARALCLASIPAGLQGRHRLRGVVRVHGVLVGGGVHHAVLVAQGGCEATFFIFRNRF